MSTCYHITPNQISFVFTTVTLNLTITTVKLPSVVYVYLAHSKLLNSKVVNKTRLLLTAPEVVCHVSVNKTQLLLTAPKVICHVSVNKTRLLLTAHKVKCRISVSAVTTPYDNTWRLLIGHIRALIVFINFRTSFSVCCLNPPFIYRTTVTLQYQYGKN
jgi:hypothetical protein